ncbi:MAG: hypothetical protein ACPGNV_14965 [Mangrovicoccus sp.]
MGVAEGAEALSWFFFGAARLRLALAAGFAGGFAEGLGSGVSDIWRSLEFRASYHPDRPGPAEAAISGSIIGKLFP